MFDMFCIVFLVCVCVCRCFSCFFKLFGQAKANCNCGFGLVVMTWGNCHFCCVFLCDRLTSSPSSFALRGGACLFKIFEVESV